MEQVPCNLCGGKQMDPVYTVTDTNYGTPGLFYLVRCTACGLVFQNPRPTAVTIGSYYPTESYHPFRAIHAAQKPEPQPLHWQRARRLTALIGPGRVLDVGCGNGLFLAAMAQLGWSVHGVEPNATAVEFVRQTWQVPVYQGDIFAFPNEAPVDLITFWDVLEHTHTPTAVLHRAHHLLKPQGYLALNVPNWASVERRLFQENWIAIDAPRHLYHFTPQTITSLLDRCGFLPIQLEAKAPVLSLASNTLRWFGDTFLRRGQNKKLTRNKSAVPTNTTTGGRTKANLIQLIHLAMRPPNFLFNICNRGGSITVIAQKQL